MVRDSVSLKVRQVVSEISQRPLDEVTEGSVFEADLKADSLDMVEIVTALERDFNTSVDDIEFEACLTVGQLVDLMMTKPSL